MSVIRIQVLADAENDLYEGRMFYDTQGISIGDYFLTVCYPTWNH